MNRIRASLDSWRGRLEGAVPDWLASLIGLFVVIAVTAAGLWVAWHSNAAYPGVPGSH